jgi:hypothetical protein
LQGTPARPADSLRPYAAIDCVFGGTSGPLVMMTALTLISLEIKSSARQPGDVRGNAILGVLLIIGSSLIPNAYRTPKPTGVPRK